MHFGGQSGKAGGTYSAEKGRLRSERSLPSEHGPRQGASRKSPAGGGIAAKHPVFRRRRTGARKIRLKNCAVLDLQSGTFLWSPSRKLFSAFSQGFADEDAGASSRRTEGLPFLVLKISRAESPACHPGVLSGTLRTARGHQQAISRPVFVGQKTNKGEDF